MPIIIYTDKHSNGKFRFRIKETDILSYSYFKVAYTSKYSFSTEKKAKEAGNKKLLEIMKTIHK